MLQTASTNKQPSTAASNQCTRAVLKQRAGSERGGVLVFVVLMLPALVALAGLAYDGGMLFHARRETVNVAAASARAGAADLDEGAYLWDQSLVLNPSAPATAENFALSLGVDTARASVSNGGTTSEVSLIEVTVTRTVTLTFLGGVLGPQTIEGTATARPTNE